MPDVDVRLRSRRALRQWHRRHPRGERRDDAALAKDARERGLPNGGDHRTELGLVPDPDLCLFVLQARYRSLKEVDDEAARHLRRRASLAAPEGLYRRARFIRRAQLRRLESRRSPSLDAKTCREDKSFVYVPPPDEIAVAKKDAPKEEEEKKPRKKGAHAVRGPRGAVPALAAAFKKSRLSPAQPSRRRVGAAERCRADRPRTPPDRRDARAGRGRGRDAAPVGANAAKMVEGALVDDPLPLGISARRPPTIRPPRNYPRGAPAAGPRPPNDDARRSTSRTCRSRRSSRRRRPSSPLIPRVRSWRRPKTIGTAAWFEFTGRA